MKIESNYENLNFKRAYINIQSLKKYGESAYFKNARVHVVEALKDKNTPLKKFIKEVINSKQFESDVGDCFISFEKRTHFGEGEDLFDIIKFSFPKKQKQIKTRVIGLIENNKKTQALEHYKEIIANNLAEKTTFYRGFRDYKSGSCWAQNGAFELSQYIKSGKIVEDLKEHIQKLK